MFKVRKDQIEQLGRIRRESLRRDLIGYLQRQGVEAEETEPTILVARDKAGGEVRITPAPSGVRLTTNERRTHTINWDERENLSTITDPGGTQIQFKHDENRRLTGIDRGLHGAHRFEYDRERVAAIHYPDNTSARFDYDIRGRLNSVQDRNGRIARYWYSDNDQIAAVADWQGNVTSFGCSGPGPATTVLMPNGNRRDWVSHDGKLVLFVNEQQQASFGPSAEHDDAIEIRCADGTWARYRFAGDRMVEAVNDAATVRFEYDDQGRIVKEETNGETICYQRNPVGALIGLIAPDGTTVKFVRDTEQRVSEVVDWNGGHLRLSYAANGAVAKIDYPNQVQARFASNAMGLPSELTLQGGASRPLAEYRWEDDKCDRVTAITCNGARRAYKFDGEGRILAENGTSFGLDGNGNITQSPRGQSTFDGANQILDLGGEPFQHDSRGNMIGGRCPKGYSEFTYDGLDRLISVRTPGGETKYTYDALGRRVGKETGGRATRYLWAGEQLLSEITIENGVTSRRDYIHYPEMNLPMAMRVNGECRYLHTGRRSEVLCMTGANGETLWQADYGAYGETYLRTAPESQPWRLAGHYADEETGLCYVFARYYNPELGRFLTPDPQGFAGGALNLYTYCDGDPINKIDPTGKFAILAIVAAVAVGAAIGAAVSAGIEMYKQHKTQPGKPFDWGAIASEAGKGALVGAVGTGVGLLLAPAEAAVAGVLGVVAGGAAVGAVTAGVEQCVSNALHDKPLTQDIGPAMLTGAAIGAVTAGIGAILANRARRASQALREELENAERQQAARALARPKVTVKEGKWDYFFGRVKSSPHNEQRSLQNLKDLERLGIKESEGGRERLQELFEQGMDKPAKETFKSAYGTTVTKTVEVPPNGSIDVKYFYPNGDMSATPEVSSIIPKIW